VERAGTIHLRQGFDGQVHLRKGFGGQVRLRKFGHAYLR
jgi:hypothetical protein